MTVGEDQTQVAAGPDAESMVEQITYLTSWPPQPPSEPTSHTPSSAPTANTVEVVTTPTGSHTHSMETTPIAGHAHPHGLVGGAGNPVVLEEDNRPYQITFRTIDDYSPR